MGLKNQDPPVTVPAALERTEKWMTDASIATRKAVLRVLCIFQALLCHSIVSALSEGQSSGEKGEGGGMVTGTDRKCG
jgi:hypothetical protein